MGRYVMAIDQGTTSSKAFIIDEGGEIIGQGGHAFRQIYPEPGWVEHDPMEIWETQKRACQGRDRGCLDKGGRPRRPGDNQSTGDDRRVGAGNGQARCERHRVAVPEDIAPLREAHRTEQGRRHPAEDGPPHRRLFLGHQTPVDTSERPARDGKGRKG